MGKLEHVDSKGRPNNQPTNNDPKNVAFGQVLGLFHPAAEGLRAGPSRRNQASARRLCGLVGSFKMRKIGNKIGKSLKSCL